MQRSVLNSDRVRSSIHSTWSGFHSEIVQTVREAVDRDVVVVVGMATNPPVKKSMKTLATAGIPFTYLEFGGYTSKWKERLAIKMWSGWPTFPQVFIRGQLVGGASDLKKLADSGELQQLVAGSGAAASG